MRPSGARWREASSSSLWVGLCLVGPGFLPTTLALLSTVWKDVGLGVSLLLASALLHTARRRNSKSALLVSVPFLFYGYGVRQNAAPAVLPLSLWSGFVALRVFRAPEGKVGLRARTALALAVGLASFLLLTVAVLASARF